MNGVHDNHSTANSGAKLVRSITTLAQREIFLTEQIQSGTKTILWYYHIIHGPLNLELLADVINQLILQIPLLQTRFVFSDGELWQVYDQSIHRKIKTIDISSHSKPLEEALRRMKEAANQSGFMTSDTLYEFIIYIIDSNTFVFYTQFHHGIIDGRSWAKLMSMIWAAYNDSKQGKPITVQPASNFDALAQTDAAYVTSDEFKEDEKFWKDYVQHLKCQAYTQRNIKSSVNEIPVRCTHSLDANDRQRLQQATAAMNISESVLYIGAAALCFRSLLGNDYVSLSVPVRGTNPTQELGMTSNVVPLLLHIPGDAVLEDVLIQIAKEIKSILVHQRFRIDDIRRLAKCSSNNNSFGLANYKSDSSFGPYINILRFDHGSELEGCTSSSHFGRGVDTNELQIRFWTDDRNGRLDMLFDDIPEAQALEQLTSLKNRLIFILNLLANTSNSRITIDTLDEQCREALSNEQSNNFYANRRFPVAAGFLQWTDYADSLVRLVNSNTWVGSGPSPFAISKVLLADRVVGISGLQRVADSISNEAPGKLLKIDEHVWHVAASDGIVELSGFFDECGKHLTARALAKQCHLHESDRLPLISPQQAEWLTFNHAQAMRSEKFWSNQLVSYKASKLSMLQNCSTHSSTWTATAYQSLSMVKANVNELLVAWLIYIARDTQMSELQIGWDATEFNSHHKDDNAITHLFSNIVPFSTCIELNDNFSNVLASVEEDYEQMVHYLPCLSDVYFRHATNSSNSLNANNRHSIGKSWPLAVSVINEQRISISRITNEYNDTWFTHGGVLMLQISKQNSSFRWIYDKNQISEEEINRITTRLFVLLASSREHVNKPVGKLDLLPESERELLLNIFNDTDISFPTKNYIHQLFEEQVTRNGQAIAVECEGQTLTYAELNYEANRLAHHLIEQGVKPDNRVALCVKRSLKMIIAILGILKSGGAYIPLDPIYSSERLKNILKDSDPLCLLADTTGQNALGDHQVPMVDLDKALSTNLSIDNPDPSTLGLTPSHLAYVIYTSGSTGTPKGVMVEHRTVLNYLQTIDHMCDLTDKDIWCLFQSFSFDFSVSEIYGTWYYGSKLVIIPQEITRSPSEFYRLICEQRVTVLHQTPGALKAFQIAESESTQKHNLRWILFGGESIEPVSLRRWYKTQNNLQLVNMYGPTETTIAVTSWIYDMKMPENAALPIGRPLSNIRLYLLDAFGELVPLGAEGELYIGGVCVARGYLNRPELTAERFLPDPFSEDITARMYRSGDRARYLPDGNLVFCGRTDQQVKIRGFRIEPGEIEARLIEHPLVRDVLVHPWNESPGSHTKLVAYVVADPDPMLAQNLRTHLASHLPDYMVPAAFVCLSSLPVIPNGKIDRRALPAPDDDAFARQPYETPQGVIEEKLAAIWSKLLGIECISRHDNFFELGGHSLLVVQFINQTKQLFNDVFIDTRSLFMYPVLKDFAKMILVPKRLYSDVAIPIRQSGDQTPIFMLPNGWGEIFYAFAIVHEIDKCFPVYGLTWLSPEEKQPNSIEEMANTMIAMIKKVQLNGPYAIVGYSAGGILAYEIANQLIKHGDSVVFLGFIDTYPLMSPMNETHNFLDSLADKFPFFTTLKHDNEWWDRVQKLSLNEAIEEVKKLKTELTISFLEWEAVLVKQRGHYINLCIEYQFNELMPIKINLFKATECKCGGTIDDSIETCCKYSERRTWKNRPISIDTHPVPGHHFSMLSNLNNRTSLGKKVNQTLISNII